MAGFPTTRLLSLGLDYIRWTQLTPMLLAWGFALSMLVLLLALNFQQQTLSAFEYVIQWLKQMPLLGDYFTALLSAENSGSNITMDDLKAFALRGWFFLSLIFMLVDMAVSAWLGPFQPWSLKRKILYTGFGCLLLLAGFVCIYFFGSERFNGSMTGWMLNFSFWALLVFLGSVYSLTVSHLLERVNQALGGSSDKL